MTQKRFTLEMQYWKGNPQGRKLVDNLTGQDEMSVEELCDIASALHCKCEELESVNEVYEKSLNKLENENKKLKQLLKLIAEADTFTKVNSVKEVLRNEIKGIDTVAEYSAEAWKDYCILSKFFKEEYGEHWDNYD